MTRPRVHLCGDPACPGSRTCKSCKATYQAAYRASHKNNVLPNVLREQVNVLQDTPLILHEQPVGHTLSPSLGTPRCDAPGCLKRPTTPHTLDTDTGPKHVNLCALHARAVTA